MKKSDAKNIQNRKVTKKEFMHKALKLQI